MKASDPRPSNAPREPVTVPVILDGIPTDAPDPGEANPPGSVRAPYRPGLARCIYFSIAAEDPGTSWMLGLDGLQVPFLMLGLQGIIHRPVGARTEFTHPALLRRLIRLVEAQPGMSVETEYLWLPAPLVDGAWARSREGREGRGRTPGGAPRGSVFRVGERRFAAAFRAARAGTGFEGWMEGRVDEGPGASLRYSPVETVAVREWSWRTALESEEFTRAGREG